MNNLTYLRDNKTYLLQFSFHWYKKKVKLTEKIFTKIAISIQNSVMHIWNDFCPENKTVGYIPPCIPVAYKTMSVLMGQIFLVLVRPAVSIILSMAVCL